MSAWLKLWAAAMVVYLSAFPAAMAQALPVVQEFYFDPDPMAVPMRVVDGMDDSVVEGLMRQRERGRRGVEASVQLAAIALRSDREALAMSLYEDAAGKASSTQMRGVRWNQGWELYRKERPEDALAAWIKSLESTRLSPSWVPPTLALVLWRLGRHDEAVQWYAAAVRTEPEQWSDTARFSELLPEWDEAERDMLRQVHARWTMDPPVWSPG